MSEPLGFLSGPLNPQQNDNKSILERAARASDRTVDFIQDAQAAMSMGDTIAAEEALSHANEDAQAAYLLLLSAGVKKPEGAPGPKDVPFHLLDTPATRRLLDALQFAVQCAQDVDRERGHVLANGTGIGWTDTVGDVYERFRQQTQGRSGNEKNNS